MNAAAPTMCSQSKMQHTHFHTHVNTHSCDCGRTHVSAHTHAHIYPAPLAAAAEKQQTVASRTRSKMAKATWENTPWHIADADLADLLDFLNKSDDPWERSLIPAVEKDAIDRAAKRAKRAVF